MIVEKFIKNPFFMIGILMMFIFLWDINQKDGFFAERKEVLQAHSCHAVLVNLKRRVPATWSLSCRGNNMEVTIIKDIKKESLTKEATLQEVLYREMANDLMFLSRTSPSDNLERTHFITVKFEHPDLKITALTEGRYLARLSTLTEPRMIAEHLRATVQVQESSSTSN